MDKTDHFRRRIFYADNRNCGEKYAEQIVACHYKMTKINGRGFDLGRNGRRWEVKCVRIVEERTDDNEHLGLLERAIDFANYDAFKFSGNIQHLKLQDFHGLFYVLFFRNDILIFEISVEDLRKHADMIGYCATQGWRSVPHDDGQFSVRNSNLHIHLRRFLRARLTYAEALNTVTSLDVPIRATTLRVPDMEPNILSYVRANPGNTVRSYAVQLNLPQRTVHDALNTPDGRMLADLGLLATEEGVQLPPWARLEDGSRNPNVKLVPKPERALIVIPQPQKSGAKTFDDVNLEAHGVDNILVNGTMRQKRDALRDKENVEGMRAMVVARMNDQLDARDDNLDGLRIALRAKDVALAAKDDALTSKDKTLTIIEAENARLHKEIAVLRAA